VSESSIIEPIVLNSSELGNPLFGCKNLGKTFTSQGSSVEVIKDLTLDVYQGDFTALMGGSGSGKSTLLYLLSGLETITSGNVWFENHDLSTMSEKAQSILRRKGMGFVFQAFNLVPNLSLLENILVAGYLGSTDKNGVEKKAMSILNSMELGDLSERLPSQVSGGQQQRASIARSLINCPDVLFADEPTGALNSSAGEMVLDHFSQLAKQGQTIFMVTHELRAACRGDRVLYMKDGKLHGEYRFSVSEDSYEKREKSLFNWLSAQGW
jgi:putative ABC transport system ATP-binding protein